MEIRSISDPSELGQTGFCYAPDSLYFSGPGMSQSLLKKVLISPQMYYHSMNSPTDDKTEAMKQGTRVHTAFLEPELFSENYCTRPPGLERRSKAGKEAYEIWAKDNVGKEEIKVEQRDLAMSVALALSDHERIPKIMENAKREVVAYADLGPFLCRGKIDIVLPDGDLLFDLKTTADCSPDGFKKSIHKYGYDFQGAFYSDIYQKITGRIPDFLIIAVEPKPPFPITIHHLGDEWIRKGRAKYQRAMELVQECQEKELWPGYPSDFIFSEPEHWMQEADAI